MTEGSEDVKNNCQHGCDKIKQNKFLSLGKKRFL